MTHTTHDTRSERRDGAARADHGPRFLLDRSPAAIALDPTNATRPTGEWQALRNREDDPPA